MAGGDGATRGGERTAIGWGLRPYRRASRVAFGMFMSLLAGRVPARPRDWAATLRRREEGEVSWSGRDSAAVVANVIVVVVGRGIRVIQLGAPIYHKSISAVFGLEDDPSAAATSHQQPQHQQQEQQQHPCRRMASSSLSRDAQIVSYSSGLRRFQHRPRDNARAAAAVQLNQSGIFMR